MKGSPELIVYYSRTGTTRELASMIAETLDDPTVERIRPRKGRSYLNWLARSFVPGSRVGIDPIETDLQSYDRVFLGTPKWTLSCPPVTEYLHRATLRNATIGLFITYGGFDEERYLDALVAEIEDRGAAVPATLRVQRDIVGTEDAATAVDEFCEAIVE